MPGGVFVSNGPGNPEDVSCVTGTIPDSARFVGCFGRDDDGDLNDQCMGTRGEHNYDTKYGVQTVKRKLSFFRDCRQSIPVFRGSSGKGDYPDGNWRCDAASVR